MSTTRPLGNVTIYRADQDKRVPLYVLHISLYLAANENTMEEDAIRLY